MYVEFNDVVKVLEVLEVVVVVVVKFILYIWSSNCGEFQMFQRCE